MISFKKFQEQITMSVGSGAVAGLAPDVPPVPKNVTTNKKMLRRVKPHNIFGGIPVFKVRSEDFHKAVHGKKKYKHYTSYVSGSLGEDIREFAAQNPSSGIIVQDEITGAMFYLRHRKR
jgi:hypothetical protein